jgi:hypothetical protein
MIILRHMQHGCFIDGIHEITTICYSKDVKTGEIEGRLIAQYDGNFMDQGEVYRVFSMTLPAHSGP